MARRKFRPKLLFIHVPKTGGQSVRRFTQLAGRPLGPGHGRFHMTAHEMRMMIGAADWSRIKKFATVRNPSDRFASACRQARLDPNSDEAKQTADVSYRSTLNERLLMSQTEMLFLDGEIAVDQLFRFEDPECHEGIHSFLCDELNIEYTEMGGPPYPCKNARKGGPLTELTSETKQWIRKFYAADFEFFQYSED